MTMPRRSLASAVLGMIDQHGSPEERRLASTNQDALKAFLDHPDCQPRPGSNTLDIGLENRLTLKFNLIANKRRSPWGMIEQIGNYSPALRATADEVIRHRIRCHAGIKITPASAEFELYPYETHEGPLASQLGIQADFTQTGLPATPYCYGLSSDDTLSAYAQLESVSASELEQAVGFPLPAANLKTLALFHSKRSPDGRWTPSKAGIEFLPFPSHLLNNVLTHFQLNFAYLIHRGGFRPYGVIGSQGSRQVLYTTLLPTIRPTRSDL